MRKFSSEVKKAKKSLEFAKYLLNERISLSVNVTENAVEPLTTVTSPQRSRIPMVYKFRSFSAALHNNQLIAKVRSKLPKKKS